MKNKAILIVILLFLSIADTVNAQEKKDAKIENNEEINIDKIQYSDCFLTNKQVDQQCINRKILQYIADHFDAGIVNELKLNEITDLNTSFKIDKKGYAKNIKTKSDVPQVNNEIERILLSMPPMPLDKLANGNITGQRSLLIALKIKNINKKNKKRTKNKDNFYKTAHFYTKKSGKKPKKIDFKQEILQFITEHLKIKKLPLNTEKIIFKAGFTVDKTGKTGHIKIEAKNKEIKNEISNILHKLPLLKTGRANDIAINSYYQYTYEITSNNITKKSNIKLIKVNNENDKILFIYFLNTPIYPGCNLKLTNERKKCMSYKIKKFVSRNFDTSIIGDLGLSGTYKIILQFTINKQGKIEKIKAESRENKLAIEAKKVISQLPEIKPGLINGKPVRVTYRLPIMLRIDE